MFSIRLVEMIIEKPVNNVPGPPIRLVGQPSQLVGQGNDSQNSLTSSAAGCTGRDPVTNLTVTS